MIKQFVPKTLKEALEILSTNNCYIMSGGTDLMVQKHKSSGLLPVFDKDILYVANLKELDYITEDKKTIYIGAETRYIEMLNSPLIPDVFKEVISEIASPAIRNMATMAGNIANASPAGDTLVPLNLFDASIILQSKDKKREVLVRDFIQGVRKIDRHQDEMITEIRIPKTELKTSYTKVGSRKAESITKISFMGGYRIEDGIIKDLRIAFGSVSIKVIRSLEIEQKYTGISANELRARIDDIVNEYDWLVKPITDQRSTKEYRKKVAFNLLRDFLKKVK